MNSINISSIRWPENPKEAINLYLGFLIKVISTYGISFPASKPDPLLITEQYMADIMPEAKYRNSANLWWQYLDDNEITRDFQSKHALIARIAICLLSATEEEAENLGEHLSWFFEILEQVGIDLGMPIEMMSKHFDFA